MISKALAKIRPSLILVVGDLVLDTYTFGSTKRISPEAPVPVLLVDREEAKAGGAGNVALNLVTLGMNVRMLGLVGKDSAGQQLLSMLASENVDVSGVFQEEGFFTPTKMRVIARSQQLLRVDKEKQTQISPLTEHNVLSRLSSLMEGVDLVAVSDYAKGFLSDTLLRAVIDCATMRGIPCIVDPKATDFRKYAGCTILKPNESETRRASPGSETLEEAAFALLEQVPTSVLMVTRSEAGISLFYPSGKTEHYPVKRKEVCDATGAGDTVLAVISAAYASKLPLSEAVPLANIAAACSVESIGCARISLHDIAKHLFDIHHSEKVMTGESFASVLKALGNEKILMIQIGPGPVSQEKILRLAAVARGYPDKRVVACFDDEIHDRSLLELIASLEPFRFVIHGIKAESLVTSSNHQVISL